MALVKRKKGRKTPKIYALNVERVTICVPKQLRRRMLKFAGIYHVNWSAIAVKAIRAHIRKNTK